MSVRAFKIITEPKVSDNPSFNLWHDEKLVEYLLSHTNFYSQLGDDGTGTTGLEVWEIKEIINNADSLQLDQETVNQLKKDIEGLSVDDFVSYECF